MNTVLADIGLSNPLERVDRMIIDSLSLLISLFLSTQTINEYADSAKDSTFDNQDLQFNRFCLDALTSVFTLFALFLKKNRKF